MVDMTENEDKRAVIKSKLRQNFDGKIVRKDLTKKIKAGEDQKNELSGIKDQIQKEEEEAEDAKLDDIIADDDFFVNE